MLESLSLTATRRVDPVGDIQIRFNELLAEKRKATGENITLQTVALETKLAYGTVQKWAKNQVDRYDKATLVTLCEYFGVQPGELLVYTPDDAA